MLRRFVATLMVVLCALLPMTGARMTFCICFAGAGEALPAESNSCCAKPACCRNAAPVDSAARCVSSTHACECCLTLELADHTGNREAIAAGCGTPSTAVALSSADPFATAFPRPRNLRWRAPVGALTSPDPPRYALRI